MQAGHSPSPPLGAERVGVRWGSLPLRTGMPPTSPSHACGAGTSLSPLKGGEGLVEDFEARGVMADTILYDSAMRLFGDLVTPQVLAAAEMGVWPAGLWQAVEETGYSDVLAEGPSGMVEAATILRAAGHHAAPIPLAETMLARWLCSACGTEAPADALTVGPVEPEDRLAIAEATVSGHARHIPWGRAAAAVVLIAGGTLLVV